MQTSIPFKKGKETAATPMDMEGEAKSDTTPAKKSKGKAKHNPYVLNIDKSIPIKPHENYSHMKKRYKDVKLELCTKPYITLLRNSEEDNDPLSFHNDLSFLVKAIGRIFFDTNAMLAADQLKAVKNDAMTTKDWVKLTSIVISNHDNAEEFLTPEDVITCGTILSRLSHTDRQSCPNSR